MRLEGLSDGRCVLAARLACFHRQVNGQRVEKETNVDRVQQGEPSKEDCIDGLCVQAYKGVTGFTMFCYVADV